MQNDSYSDKPTLDQELTTQPDTAEMTKAKKHIKEGAIACYVIGGLSILVAAALLGGALDFIQLDQAAGIGVMIEGAIFIALGLWSRSQPSVALLLAILLYTIDLIYFITIIVDMGGRMAGGMILRGILLGLLIRAWMQARKLKKLQTAGPRA